MTPNEERGYDDFVTIYVRRGVTPATAECPGLSLPIGSDERKEYMRGWLKARDDV